MRSSQVNWHLTSSVTSEQVSEVAQSCPILCDPMDCSLPGSSMHGIFQARVLEWVAISFSRESSWPRDQTQISHTAVRHFTVWATRDCQNSHSEVQNLKEGIQRPSLDQIVTTESINCNLGENLYCVKWVLTW